MVGFIKVFLHGKLGKSQFLKLKKLIAYRRLTPLQILWLNLCTVKSIIFLMKA